MPASSRSLDVTNAYRRRVVAIRERVTAAAVREWPTIDRLDASRWNERMAVVVAGAQTEAVRAAAGYLTAYLSTETGRRQRAVRVDSRRYAGVSRDGRPLREAFESPLIGVRAALKDGKTEEEALRYGLGRATRMVSVDFDHAHRSALLQAIDQNDRFSGWQRVVRGTCAACLAVTRGKEEGTHFDVHPHCQCVSEPVVNAQPDDFAKKAKKGDRIETLLGYELKKGQWAPVEGPVRGTIVKADDAQVMFNAGTASKPRWITAKRADIGPIQRKAAKVEGPELIDVSALPKIEPTLKGQALRDALEQPREAFPLSQRNAIKDYTGGKGDVAERMNRSLRKETFGPRSRDAGVAKEMDAAFASLKPLQEPALAFRGTKVKLGRQLQPGAVIEDKGFMSTSASRTVAEGFAGRSRGDLFEVVLPKGTKALDINEAAGSKYGFEREVLLPRGTRMVVESIKADPKRPGYRIIRARVLL